MSQSDDSALHAVLDEGLKRLSLDFPSETKLRFVKYIRLLLEANRLVNLTAIKDPEDAMWRHVIDSLTAYRFVKDFSSIIDVGTGAGLPGIILALAMPKTQFTLLDSNSKKMRFCETAINALNINNVTLQCVNTKLFKPVRQYDAVITRAFSAMDLMLEQTQHLCKPTGTFFAMKGRVEEEELAKISKEFKVEAIHSVSISDEMAHRHIVVIRHARSISG